MKRIALLTSGGDAPGMNACYRAIVRYGIYSGLEVYAVERGYTGLINDDIFLCNKRSVSDIIQRGGTVIKTARCPEFSTYEGRKIAAGNLANRKIDGLVVLGGDGSFRGADAFYNDFGVKTIGIPCTIDNDMHYTDYTLGFDTTCNTVLSAINNLRDTMTSHDLVNILEVMGRKCGDIALYAGIGGGCEYIIVPELPFDLDKICQGLKESREQGKTSNIIILAEGVMTAKELQEKIKAKVDVSLRTTVLGHIQRGGTPTMRDRLLAAQFAERAVDLLVNNIGGRAVGIKNNKIVDVTFKEAVDAKRNFNEKLYDLAHVLNM